VFQAKKSQTIETNLKNITLAKFDLDFEVGTFNLAIFSLILLISAIFDCSWFSSVQFNTLFNAMF